MKNLICIFLLAGTCMVAAFAQGKDPVDIGNRRELFLDNLLVDRLEGEARRIFHKPVPREIVMTFDKPWEGNTVHDITVFKDSDLYRMYYRASTEGVPGRVTSYTAYAESRDGIHWTRPNLGLVEFDGSTDNNILRTTPARESTYVVFRDENPSVQPEARYKAVGYRRGPGQWPEVTKELVVYQSPDGIHWELIQEEAILDDGYFDSQNLAFWDPNIGAYRTYYRSLRRVLGDPDHWHRGIKTATSPEFTRHWPEQGTELNYKQRPHAQLYNNVIRSYHRAPHIYVGMPKMYDDRGREAQEFLTAAAAQLPEFEKRLEINERIRRFTPQSETHLMWSRNGRDFDLAPSAFITPGPERPSSWTYSDAVAWHIVETKSVFEGAAPELTIYAMERYRFDDVQVRRFTLRLDGFASIHAPIAGGELITPPLVFEGSALSMNFASSAFGSLRVELQDADGTPIPGFTLDDSIELYGDTVARNAMWKGDPDLGALSGQPVRLRFLMRDADLYSIKFE